MSNQLLRALVLLFALAWLKSGVCGRRRVELQSINNEDNSFKDYSADYTLIPLSGASADETSSDEELQDDCRNQGKACTDWLHCCSGNYCDFRHLVSGKCLPLPVETSAAVTCRPLWDNMCKTDSECCSGNCEKGNPNWATGVCKPPSGGDSVSQQEFTDAVTRNNFPYPSGDQYSGFINGLPRGEITTKLEAAMALAQFLHESGGLVYKREIVCDNGNNCPNDYRTPGCDAPGQYYFGRGYIQLSWCGNYLAAGQDLGIGDALVQDPDRVAREEQMAWDTAFSYWKRQVHNFPGVQQGQFGASTRAINGQQEECQGNGKNADESRRRFQIYTAVFQAFGLPSAPDESGCNY